MTTEDKVALFLVGISISCFIFANILCNKINKKKKRIENLYVKEKGLSMNSSLQELREAASRKRDFQEKMILLDWIENGDNWRAD